MNYEGRLLPTYEKYTLVKAKKYEKINRLHKQEYWIMSYAEIYTSNQIPYVLNFYT